MKRLLTISALFCTLFVQAQIKATSAQERLKTIDQRKQLLSRSTLNETGFRNIGPSIMSGRVVDIEVNPQDPTEFYVAYASGGLWHTKNNGQSFAPIFDSVDVLTIGDIAVNWQNRHIWVGTGEVNSSRSTYAGLGVYRSANNGKSWEYLGLPESHHIGKIQLSAKDPNTAWVAVLGHLYSESKERGIYKTTDAGKTWNQTLASDANTGAIDVDIDPSNEQVLYAAMWYRTRTASNFEESGKTSGIFKSTDGGDHWTLVSTPTSGFPSGDGVGRIGLAVYPKNPSIVYAIVDNNFHQPDTAMQKAADTSRYVLRDFKTLTVDQFLALDDKKLNAFLKSPRNGIPTKYNAENIKKDVQSGKLAPNCIWDYLYDANTALFETPIYGAQVYRSDNAGLSWVKTHAKPIDLYSTYGYYFGKVFVSPSNPDKIAITGVGVLLSTDGGKTFNSIGKENVHADHHFVWMNGARDSHMIIGNDGGCNITYDNGAHWFKANTPAVGQFYNIAIDMAKPYNVYGGLQDNGTWFGSSATKENYDWYDNGHNPYTMIGGGDGMQVQVDWRDNKTVYSGSQFGFYSRQNLATKDRKAVRPMRDLGEPAVRYNWQSPILLSRHNQDVFYFGSNKFHRSMSKGDSLVTLSTDLTTNPTQGDVPFGTTTTISESPIRFGLIYVGTDDGNVQVSKDGGNSFTMISQKLPKGLYVSRVIASKYNVARVYVTLNGYRNDHFNAYVYQSDDYGTTWKQIMKDLPSEPVNVIKEDAVAEQVLYVGTDGGLYVSLDGGNSSMAWTKGLPASVPVHDLEIHPRDHEIVLGTHGRSLYVGKLDALRKQLK
ncbi:MAG: hypothetical protein K9G23_06005 [Chitinophagaceae bacterium]|nr:hypothetical protein [Chitinophagaceae bacterium]